eukprot:1621312-Karenia_brevis.AAC.1
MVQAQRQLRQNSPQNRFQQCLRLRQPLRRTPGDTRTLSSISSAGRVVLHLPVKPCFRLTNP